MTALNKNSAYTLLALLNGRATSSEIVQFLKTAEIRTVQRALERLLGLGLVTQTGPINAPIYTVLYEKLVGYDIAEKLLLAEERPETGLNFDFITWLSEQTAQQLDEMFSDVTLPHASAAMSPRELEYITIEFSWKSSALEGNTYTLLDTQLLLTEGIRPKNRTEFETQMILNHKNAISFIVKNPEEFTGRIRFAAVEELHRIIGDNLGIASGVRKKMVKISASNYTPLAGPAQLRELAETILDIIARPTNPATRALLALGLVPYLQIFEDGNKRTGRMLANAILMSIASRGFSLRGVEARTLALAYLRLYEFTSFHSLQAILTGELAKHA